MTERTLYWLVDLGRSIAQDRKVSILLRNDEQQNIELDLQLESGKYIGFGAEHAEAGSDGDVDRWM